MIYPNNPLYLLSLLGYIYYLTCYTLTTKDNIVPPYLKPHFFKSIIRDYAALFNLIFSLFRSIVFMLEVMNYGTCRRH